MKQHLAQAVIIRRSILEDVFKDFNHSSRIRGIKPELAQQLLRSSHQMWKKSIPGWFFC